ncbi:hypothetical protein D3874_16585 [Oleomonas cavernae]|uniref:Uncharacterized protein n=1 Tax=Oleomonas cavernae TaxID=2320859 RepID=A0A418WEK9_9PROT|nr:hypothetical protein D3874_16585 [Oleomonas cavernae]
MLLQVVLAVLVAGSAAHAADQTLLGAWKISDAVMAPWVAQQSPDEVAEMAKLKGQPVTFAAHEVIAASVIGCTDVGYEVTRIPPEGLFQGGLPEGRQAQAAAALGLPPGEVPGIDVACSTGLFSYHFRDASTALFALDNVIYTLTRQ